MRKFISIIVIIGVAIIIIPIIVMVFVFGVTPSKTKLEKELQKNEEHFINLVEFFETCGYENLWIYRDYSDGPVVASTNMGYRIQLDENIIKQFEYLIDELKYKCAMGYT